MPAAKSSAAHISNSRARQRRQPAVGGPALYGPEMLEQAAKHKRMGMTDADAAAMMGIDRTTWYAWTNKHPEFAEAVAKAEAEFVRNNVALIQRASASDARHWGASAWLLERRRPEDFGRIDRHLIRAEVSEGGSAKPAEYAEAVRKALGVSGPLVFVDAEGRPVKQAEDGETAKALPAFVPTP